MKPLLPHRYFTDAVAMREKLIAAILAYAAAHRHVSKWKKRMYAILYSGSLQTIMKIK